MSAITNIKGCNYAFESFISLLNVLGLLGLSVLVCMYCYINFKERKMFALIYVSIQPEYRISTWIFKHMSALHKLVLDGLDDMILYR